MEQNVQPALTQSKQRNGARADLCCQARHNKCSTHQTSAGKECLPATLTQRYTILYRQCRYYVTVRVHATIVVVEKQRVLQNLSVCVCSLRYPACNAHAPYCHLWPAPLYNIFPHYLINGTIFGEKVAEHKMCVLIYCTTFV